MQLNSSFTEAYINRGNVRSYLGDSPGAKKDYKIADALTTPAATFNEDRILESGNNDYQYNGVFLGQNTHKLFSSWWAGFSNRSW